MNGLRLFYQEDGPEEDGAGAPVLLLHGFARNGNFWRGWVSALARRHRAIRPDIRGCGASQDPGRHYAFRVDDLVSDYIGLLDALGIDRVHHVGESAGGIVGAVAAAQHPERFLTLSLVSTPITPLTSDPRVKSPGAATPEEALSTLGLKEWWLRSRALSGELFGDARDEEFAEEFARTPVHVALAMWRGLHQPDVTLEPYLHALTTPTLVLTPTASFTMSREQQSELVAGIVGARQRIYEGAPHGMYYLRGAELAEDVLEFIDAA